MVKDDPALQQHKLSLASRLNFHSENRSTNFVLLGLAGLFLIGFALYLISINRRNTITIHYAPVDVTYGTPLHAVHNMPGLQEVLNKPLNATVNKPVMVISEHFYDFGSVGPRQLLTRTFVIANQGQSMLLIRRAYTTCGCTVADFTSTEIPPGKVALMTLRFDASFHNMRASTVRRGVIITSNDPDQPQQEIWIQASVN
jgi:hypothetical protein